MAYVGEGTEGYVLTAGASGSAPSFQVPISSNRVSSAVTGVSISTGTPTTITSISVPAGTWDITAQGSSFNNGFTTSAFIVGISTTTNTFEGSNGDQQLIFNTTSGVFVSFSATISAFRVTPGTTTTYYLVGQVNFALGTATYDGRITAIKVAP